MPHPSYFNIKPLKCFDIMVVYETTGWTMTSDDKLPSYAEAVGNANGNTETIINIVRVEVEQQQSRQYEVRRNRQNDTVNRAIVGTENASNSFSGLLDILYEENKLPWGFVKNMIYKLGLLIYYFANFVYFIVAVAVQRENLAYHLVYMFICTIGFLFELIVIIIDVRKHFIQSSAVESPVTSVRRNQVMDTNQRRQAWTVQTQANEYSYKAKTVFFNYVLLSLGEILIHPILICMLYGFINERAWRFDNGISGCNFLFFLYSVIMDAFYTKFYAIVLVIRVVTVSYAKYDQLLNPVVEWKRYFTPIYLTIPLAFLTTLTHWLMIGIVGVRIYIDNFTLDADDTEISIRNTGDYWVAPFTGYMVACTLYLPIVSWIVYIVLNKLWFYELFSAINQMTNGAGQMPPRDSWNDKLFAFTKDPLAYITVVFLIAPFIAFTVGAYLPDYDNSDYEVSSSARNAIQGLTPCFLTFFLLANLQAVVISIIVTLMIATVVSCVVIVLCILVGYVCSLCGES